MTLIHADNENDMCLNIKKIKICEHQRFPCIRVQKDF